MVITPEMKEKVGKIVGSIHKDLVWDAEEITERIVKLNVYFPDEGKPEGCHITEYCDGYDGGIIRCTSQLVFEFLKGKLDHWLNKHHV